MFLRLEESVDLTFANIYKTNPQFSIQPKKKDLIIFVCIQVEMLLKIGKLGSTKVADLTLSNNI